MAKGGKGEETKELLIEAAVDLFSENGYDKTSVAQIAKRCGITHAAALYHFKTKLGLLEAVVETGLARRERLYEESLERTDDAWRRLRRFTQSHLTWMIVYKAEAEILLLLSYFGSVRPEFGDIYSAAVRRGREQVEELLLAGQREGVFHFEDDAEHLSRSVHDAVYGMVMNGLGARGLVESMPAYVKRADVLISRLVRYAATDEAGV